MFIDQNKNKKATANYDLNNVTYDKQNEDVHCFLFMYVHGSTKSLFFYIVWFVTLLSFMGVDQWPVFDSATKTWSHNNRHNRIIIVVRFSSWTCFFSDKKSGLYFGWKRRRYVTRIPLSQTWFIIPSIVVSRSISVKKNWAFCVYNVLHFSFTYGIRKVLVCTTKAQMAHYRFEIGNSRGKKMRFQVHYI